MVRIRIGFSTYTHNSRPPGEGKQLAGSALNSSRRQLAAEAATRHKPIVLPRWPSPGRFEDDEDEEESAPENNIKPSFDDDLSKYEDNEPASEQGNDSSSDEEVSASGDYELSSENNKLGRGDHEPQSILSQSWAASYSFGHRRLIASGSINGKKLDAIADSGASFSVISQELAGTLGLDTDRTSAVSVCLPNGEEKSYSLLCIVLEKCVHPLVLGSQFLRVTQTLTMHTDRITKVFSNIFSLNFLDVLGAENDFLVGYLNGQPANIVPDTGSDIMVMSLPFAKQLGLSIHNRPQDRSKVQFIDGSEAYTIGKVRGVKWQFQKYLDWGSHTQRRYGYEFHIIRHLPVDVIVSNDFIDEVGVFKNHIHRLVSHQSEEVQSGIYGIRYIKSLRARKRVQCSRGQTSSAEMEESELLRRVAAEEDIEELLLTDPVAAESKRLQEHERRIAQEEHKRRCNEARLASIPQTGSMNTRRVALQAQQSNTGSSLHNTSMNQQSTYASYQSQAGTTTAAGFDVEPGRPQPKRRRLELPEWLAFICN